MNDDQEVVTWFVVVLLILAMWLVYKPYLSALLFGKAPAAKSPVLPDPGVGPGQSGPAGQGNQSDPGGPPVAM